MKNDKKENGVALILTLGILSFLLVLALGFASSAIVQKKAAVNSASVALSRLLAESAAEKCLAGLAFYTDNAPTAAFDVMFSHEENDPHSNNKTFDQLYRIATTQNGIKYYEWDPSYNKDAADAIHWQYVYNGESGASERILGRYAYLVIPSGGKLEPTYTVSHSHESETVNAEEYPTGIAREEKDAPEDRRGKDVCEINVMGLTNSSGYVTTTEAGKMSTKAITVGNYLDDGHEWPDIDTLFAQLALDNNHKMYWNEWFRVDSAGEDKNKEAFWRDDGDNLLEPGELYDRFNLYRFTDVAGGTAHIYDPGTDTNGFDGMAVGTIIADATAYPVAGGGIQWLKNITAVPASSTFTAVNDFKNQLAANIIDYCDRNRAATTDNAANPTYTGNDESPYINELQVEIEAAVTQTSNAGPPATRTYTCAVTIKSSDIEAIDIYDTIDNKTFNLAADVTVSGNVSWSVNGVDVATNDPFAETLQFVLADGLSTTDESYDSVVAKVFSRDIKPALFSKTDNPDPGVAQTVAVRVNITSITVKLTDADDASFYDFARVEPGTGDVEVISNNTASASASKFFHYQVDDPRQNLHTGDWDRTGNPAAATGGTFGSGAVGKNSVCNPNPGGDKDAEAGASEPWDVSTAYIRNDIMQSLWEIGLIHRAAKWETINIHKYNESQGYSSGAALGNYADGDANILDQLKLTSRTETKGKINIRAPANVDVLKALLANIKAGATDISCWDGMKIDYNNVAWNGTKIGYNSTVVNLANAISGSSKRPFLTRSQVVQVSDLSTGSITLDGGASHDLNTDARKEEIIGKFINLCGTSIADEFIIIVIAQSIKDVGGPTITKDLDYDGIPGEASASEVACGFDINGDGDATDTAGIPETIATTAGAYDQYADEILAEQKILVRVKYDSSAAAGSKWRITHYEYIED